MSLQTILLAIAGLVGLLALLLWLFKKSREPFTIASALEVVRQVPARATCKFVPDRFVWELHWTHRGYPVVVEYGTTTTRHGSAETLTFSVRGIRQDLRFAYGALDRTRAKAMEGLDLQAKQALDAVRKRSEEEE